MLLSLTLSVCLSDAAVADTCLEPHLGWLIFGLPACNSAPPMRAKRMCISQVILPQPEPLHRGPVLLLGGWGPGGGPGYWRGAVQAINETGIQSAAAMPNVIVSCVVGAIFQEQLLRKAKRDISSTGLAQTT
jgi:hypothetical protein